MNCADRHRSRPSSARRVAPTSAMARWRAFRHASTSLPHFVLGCVLAAAALWVLGGVELRLLLGADAQWSARIQPIAWVLHLHAVCGVIALASAPLQFAVRLRCALPRLHRALGVCYVGAVVAAASAAPIVAASLCEPAVQLATSMQAALWVIATLAAVRAIRARDAIRHGWWMTRSFALTYTFVLGRLFTDVFHLRLPATIGGDAALVWLLTLGALVSADMLSPAIRSPDVLPRRSRTSTAPGLPRETG